jgi:gamma-glutamyltranspeptidase/glutathione hydrolase
MRKLVGALCLAATLSAWAAEPVHARHAMVVTVEKHATDTGVAILQAGGNAVDAAVAVGFALAVTHPSAGNIGGGGFMLVRLADGRSTFLDFRERAPEKASRNMYLDSAGKPTQESTIGYRAAAVPGTVRGFEYASRKYGRKPWADLVAPAVALAEKGFPIPYDLAGSMRRDAPLLERFPESKRIFLKEGRLWAADETLVQPELARTLGRIRDLGARDFYEGETARLLIADMERHGGWIDAADLKDYAAVERTPLTGTYGAYHVITAPPPSSGGVGILQMLGVLDGSGYAKSGAGSAAELHFLTETMRRFFADRAAYLGDPDFVKLPIARLLDKAYLMHLRQSIDPEHATPSSAIHAGSWGPTESSQTTHYSIVDAEGNAVAVTYTLNGGFGDGVTVPGLGFVLNNEMDDFAAKPGEPNLYGLVQGEANAIQPRKRPLSSMTPTIVIRDGRLALVLGTPGGPTIINTVLQVLINVTDFGMNMQDAVNWPRIHHQWLPDRLVMESGFSPDTIALLKVRGHEIRMARSIGEVAAIEMKDGWLEGAADPRTEGVAKGY